MSEPVDDLGGQVEELPGRRALIVWYDDETNEIELYSEEFGPLEVPELLRTALDLAELALPTPVYDESESDDE
jgi:hypothetical protein